MKDNIDQLRVDVSDQMELKAELINELDYVNQELYKFKSENTKLTNINKDQVVIINQYENDVKQSNICLDIFKGKIEELKSNNINDKKEAEVKLNFPSSTDCAPYKAEIENGLRRLDGVRGMSTK